MSWSPCGRTRSLAPRSPGGHSKWRVLSKVLTEAWGDETPPTQLKKEWIVGGLGNRISTSRIDTLAPDRMRVGLVGLMMSPMSRVASKNCPARSPRGGNCRHRPPRQHPRRAAA